MKKEKILIGMTIADIILAIAISNLVHWLLGLAILVLGGLVILYLGMDLLMRKIINLDKPTSYFTDLSGRNMEGIVVGSTKVWKYAKVKKSAKLYSVFTYGSTTGMEFNVLKTYFGHVKRNGTVYFVYDSADGVFERKVTPIDYKVIHQHVFLQLGIKMNDKTPFKSSKKFMTKYLCNFVAKKLGLFKNGTWKYNSQVEEKNVENINQIYKLLDAVIVFCKERDLDIKLLLLDSTPRANNINQKVDKYFNEKYCESICVRIKNADELNGFLS